MNRDSEPEDDDDQALSKEFRVLREMEPPPGLREKCLAAANEAAPVMPHRSVSLIAKAWPNAGILASAVAASLLVGIGIGWSLRGATNENLSSDQSEAEPDNLVFVSAWDTNATSQVEFDERSSEKLFFVEETYLCGVGRIQSSTKYQRIGESK